jgi:hypothetical protein
MEFAPMFWPTVNSYKRLVDGFWAPVKPTWGLDNRTASFRVIAGSPKATRLETRCPGADVNPYLAMAAVIAAGLHGVEKGLKLTAPPITGTNQGGENIPRAPRSLIETTRIFQASRHRPRLARRRLRRPLRRHPRLGAPPVAGRGDRLGTEALLRNHLTTADDTNVAFMTITRFSFPTPSTSAPARASSSGRTGAIRLLEQGCKRPLIVTDRALAALPVLAEFRTHLAGLDVAVFDGVFGNPTCRQVMAGAAAFKAHGPTASSASAAAPRWTWPRWWALMAVHDGDVLEYVWDHPQVRPIVNELPYFVALPTTSRHRLGGRPLVGGQRERHARQARRVQPEDPGPRGVRRPRADASRCRPRDRRHRHGRADAQHRELPVAGLPPAVRRHRARRPAHRRARAGHRGARAAQPAGPRRHDDELA